MSGVFEINGLVGVVNGSSTVTITGGNLDCSKFSDGVIIAINDYQLVEAVAGTLVDVNGDSSITLKNPWANPTVENGSFIAFNSHEGLTNALLASKSVADILVNMTLKFKDIIDSTADTITINLGGGEEIEVIPYGKLAGIVQTLLNLMPEDGGVPAIWNFENADFDGSFNKKYSTVGNITCTLIDLVVGKEISIHCESGELIIANPSYIIRGPYGTCFSGEDLILNAGDMCVMIYKGSNVLEIV